MKFFDLEMSGLAGDPRQLWFTDAHGSGSNVSCNKDKIRFTTGTTYDECNVGNFVFVSPSIQSTCKERVTIR